MHSDNTENIHTVVIGKAGIGKTVFLPFFQSCLNAIVNSEGRVVVISEMTESPFYLKNTGEVNNDKGE